MVAFSSQSPNYGTTGSSQIGNVGPSKGPNGYNAVQVDKLTPEQMQIWNNLNQNSQRGAGQGLNYLSGIASGDEAAFAESEAPAMRQFGKLQSQTASQFSGMGMGARRGSGFANEAGGQAQEFAENMRGRRMDMRTQAIQELLGMQKNLLNTDIKENLLMPKKKKNNWWAGPAGAVVGGVFGGPAGAMAGYQIGNAAGGGTNSLSGTSGLSTSWGGGGKNVPDPKTMSWGQ